MSPPDTDTEPVTGPSPGIMLGIIGAGLMLATLAGELALGKPPSAPTTPAAVWLLSASLLLFTGGAAIDIGLTEEECIVGIAGIGLGLAIGLLLSELPYVA